MTTVSTNPMKSLYTSTLTNGRDKALRRRWWVDLSIAYVYRRDVDVENIPYLSHKLEGFVVTQIVQRINKHCMSEAYNKLQHETKGHSIFSHDKLA